MFCGVGEWREEELIVCVGGDGDKAWGGDEGLGDDGLGGDGDSDGEGEGEGDRDIGRLLLGETLGGSFDRREGRGRRDGDVMDVDAASSTGGRVGSCRSPSSDVRSVGMSCCWSMASGSEMAPGDSVSRRRVEDKRSFVLSAVDLNAGASG